ncbi:ABC transporter permease [Fodinisporobacter ferrooxydans]|uniref:ABC transporter permease n=1 Tax=Fodinisporobacter ferrooxydans TaxID=2901836 RepID=A0ABY4CR84_9BACL|nr:ABC transporter permease [Alicyclobacillaceae bacterium MYW30-H2]
MEEKLLLNQEAATSRNVKINIYHFLDKFGIFLVLIGMIVIMSILTPFFFTVGNLLDIVRQVSIVGITAIGATIVIITAGIDLSPGSVIGVASVSSALFAQSHEPVILPIIVGIVVGALAGIINGVVITKGKMAPFIVTLAMMTAARGLALLVSGGEPIQALSQTFGVIGGGYLAGIPIPIIIFLIIGVIFHIILTKTKIGKWIYAIGGNEQAAIIGGLNVDRIKIIVYSLAGLLAGVASVILTSRVGSGDPNAGLGYELDAITAAVIGGTSLTGGIGTIPGTIVGALIIGVMNNGLDLLNVPSYWQSILKGVIIALAVFIDSQRHKKKS